MLSPRGTRAFLASGLLVGAALPVFAQARGLVSQAREVQGAVSEIRQLPFLHAVSMSVKDRAAIRAYAKGRLQREFTPEELRAKSESLIAWGFVTRPFELRSFYEDLLAEQIGGYYDPFSQVFFIADWLPPLLQKPIMAHELMHALQDQHFDLEPLLSGDDANDDVSLAGAAVVEGEGLAVMLDYALRPAGLTFEIVPRLESLIDTGLASDTSGFHVYASAPPIIKETLLFPYLQGLYFVKAAKARGGWAAVSAVYRRLPASTEQIFWPEKYFEGPDHPTPISLPDVAPLLGSGWRRIDSNVLGELGFRVLLAHDGDREAAVELGRGWDGDRYELYERKRGETVLVSVSVWDSEADALAVESAWRAQLTADPETAGAHALGRRGAAVAAILHLHGSRRIEALRALLESAPSTATP